MKIWISFMEILWLLGILAPVFGWEPGIQAVCWSIPAGYGMGTLFVMWYNGAFDK